MSGHAGSHPRYLVIYCVLAAALFASIGLGVIPPSPLLITVIFAVAVVKAYLVLNYYVHLAAEPKWLKAIVVCAFALLAILWIGLVPDIVYVHGGPEDLE